MNKNRILLSLVLLVLTAIAVNAQYKFQVKEIEAEGVEFNPEYHHAGS